VRLDLRYVEHWSLALDLQILFKTCRAVLSRTGACLAWIPPGAAARAWPTSASISSPKIRR
jgi:hypothetical protein